ncbi:MAG TPA: hypothetical protein VM677_24420 [Actinokineospora sp.]|jgi:hypothetical protein|nr:hypothetical protein [Actinokineospora sp.]
MRKLLCQVCAGPADQDGDGILWVLKDHRDDWPDWPNDMGVTEPPICAPCLIAASRACPALRRGHVAVRAGRADVAGVLGTVHRPGDPPSANTLVPLDDPSIRWILAAQLARRLRHCTLRELP